MDSQLVLRGNNNTILVFFQFHWMDSECCGLVFLATSYRELSIPLNGFPYWAYNLVALKIQFFQFHWMDSLVSCLLVWLCFSLSSFNSIEWILDSARTEIHKRLKEILSIPLNGFIKATLGLADDDILTPFNSIEWIPVVAVVAKTVEVARYLSIPLNGFENAGTSRRRVQAPGAPFQFHWMDSLDRVEGLPVRRAGLSIPLNGFCTITVYVHCGNPSISIIWILFH